MSKLDDLVRKHSDVGDEVFRYVKELEKSNNDLLAETLRLGKLHDDAIYTIEQQRKALDDARGTIERLNEELAIYKSPVDHPDNTVPASIYNYTPGQRIVDTRGREYIKLQSTASGSHAVDLETGRIINLSLIIVKKAKYHE